MNCINHIDEPATIEHRGLPYCSSECVEASERAAAAWVRMIRLDFDNRRSHYLPGTRIYVADSVGCVERKV